MKRSKNARKTPPFFPRCTIWHKFAKICALFFPGGFLGTFNLKSDLVATGKSAVGDKKWKKKHFFSRFTGWRSSVPQITWGENLNFVFLTWPKKLFFEKHAMLQRAFCAISPGKKKWRTTLLPPYRPLVAQGGVSFPYVFFVQNPLLKIASKKKSERFCSTII